MVKKKSLKHIKQPTPEIKLKFSIFTWFLVLLPIVILSQYFLLQPQQQYGFYDVDWGFLSYFLLPHSNPYTLHGILERFIQQGAYGHQSYYVGTLVTLLGYNFRHIQIATQIFKTFGILAMFLAIAYTTEAPLLAFLSAIILAFSYASIGSLSNVVTGADYLGIIAMSCFFGVYFTLIKKQKFDFKYLALAGILFYLSLVVSTIRIFPLVFILLLTEIYLFFRNRKRWKFSLSRIAVFFTPIIIVCIILPTEVFSWLLSNGPDHITKIQHGDLSMALEPFMSLGSSILPYPYWQFLGVMPPYYTTSGSHLHFLFNDYFITVLHISKYVFARSLIIFIMTSILLGILLFEHPKKFIIRTIVGTLILGTIAVFFMANTSQNSLDISFLNPALMGIYILVLGVASYFEWKQDNNAIYFILFISPIFAQLWIFFTWIATNNIPFFAPHRYITMASVWVSIFLGSLFYITFKKLRKYSLKFSLLPFLLLIPLFFLDITVIQGYFDHELSIGYGARDQIAMRNELNKYLTKLPSDKPSLFYFDFTQDEANKEYYGTTLTNGFPTWMLWNPHINFNERLTPDHFWDNLPQLQSYIATQSGVTGFYKDKVFYSPSHFYAFQVKNKKIVNITEDTLHTVGVK
jgi:hypothetical protein